MNEIQPAFAFAFAHASEQPDASRADAPPAGSGPRSARAVPLHELDSVSEDWPVDVVCFGPPSEPHALRKCALPEGQAAAALCAELATTGAHNTAKPDLLRTDLVRNVYEGGFKLWECAHDLLEVLRDVSHRGELELGGAAVLEAGCGVGLPGAYVLQRGAGRLVMQDFNAAVLRLVTAQTFRLNGLWPRVEAGHVRFLSGDWAGVGAVLAAEQRGDGDTGAPSAPHATGVGAGGPARRRGFDLILSADTIYSMEATRRLWQLLCEQLRVGGTALIAAKSYYFGVGGSVAEFCALVDADGRFECRRLRTFEDGASNRREVLSVRWLRFG